MSWRERDCYTQNQHCGASETDCRLLLEWWMPLSAGDIRVLEGHAFIVEAAVSVGGRDMKQGINVHRFANRIPLLFEVWP